MFANCGRSFVNRNIFRNDLNPELQIAIFHGRRDGVKVDDLRRLSPKVLAGRDRAGKKKPSSELRLSRAALSADTGGAGAFFLASRLCGFR